MLEHIVFKHIFVQINVAIENRPEGQPTEYYNSAFLARWPTMNWHLVEERLEEEAVVTRCLESSINNVNTTGWTTFCRGGLRHCKMCTYFPVPTQKEFILIIRQ